MKLLEWIDENKINWSILSSNPCAVNLLKKIMKKSTGVT